MKINLLVFTFTLLAQLHIPVYACKSDDGLPRDSRAHVCRWDARSMGNGQGQSFIAFDGGTDHALFVYPSFYVQTR